MTPKFRAYDGSSLNRMYQPYEVMVGGGNIWIIDEDSVAGEWIVNNDLILMQSTGLRDKNCQEIFEGDIIADAEIIVDVKRHETLGFYTLIDGRENFFGNGMSIEKLEQEIKGFSEMTEIVGNIYENISLLELLEDKEE